MRICATATISRIKIKVDMTAVWYMQIQDILLLNINLMMRAAVTTNYTSMISTLLSMTVRWYSSSMMTVIPMVPDTLTAAI